MKRLSATIRCDLRLQWRNGFYYATAVILAAWGALASQLQPGQLGRLMPLLLGGNLLVTTFYFVAGLMLLEKAEGTLTAQIVTPLRPGEYLASKLITLCGLALLENVLLAALLHRAALDLPLLALGLALGAAVYTLAGVIAVARYDTLNGFLMPSALVSGGLQLPMVGLLYGVEPWLLFWHPLGAPLILLRAAFTPTAPWLLAAALLVSLGWIAVLWIAARRAFVRAVVASVGAEG